MTDKKHTHKQRTEVVINPAQTIAEEYIPSESIEKYPNVAEISYQYKILEFRNDYIKLQEEVTKHLNDGWKLAGGLATCMNVSPFETVTIFSQAITKQ